ncbi:hypothetical protein ACWGPO_22970 [Achromobacter animicus]
MSGRDPEDDPIVDFILHIGPARFVALLLVGCLAGFCVAHRIASLIWS